MDNEYRMRVVVVFTNKLRNEEIEVENTSDAGGNIKFIEAQAKKYGMEGFRIYATSITNLNEEL